MAQETNGAHDEAGDTGPDHKGHHEEERPLATGPDDKPPPSEKKPVVHVVHVVSRGAADAGDPAQDGSGGSAAPAAAPAPYSCFSAREKHLIVLAGAVSALFSPLTGQIYLPALNVIAEELGVSGSQVNLTVTSYMVLQGVAPMFVGGLADTAGRRPALVLCFAVYGAANVGAAACTTYAGLLALRCLQSAGVAGTVTLGQAVMADTVAGAERGRYSAITTLPAVLAPCLGPVLGGALAQHLGWRAVFWFLAACAAVMLVLVLLLFPETCRALVGDGSTRPPPLYRTPWQVMADRRRRGGDKATPGRDGDRDSNRPRPRPRIGLGNPLGSLTMLFEPLLGALLGYSAVVFAGFYAIATAMPSQLQRQYGFDDVTVGLMYLPMAGGSAVAALAAGRALDWNYRRHAARQLVAGGGGGGGAHMDMQDDDVLSGFPLERARLEVGLPLLALSAAVLLAWGWALQRGAHAAVLCVLLFLMGAGFIGYINASSVLVVDMYPARAGAATAANNLTRCLLGAAATAAVTPMTDAIGAGWTFTVFGSLYLAGAPLLLLIMKNGIGWRRKIRAREERRRVKAEEREEMERSKNDTEGSAGGVQV